MATATFGAKVLTPLNARGALVVKADAEAIRERVAIASFMVWYFYMIYYWWVVGKYYDEMPKRFCAMKEVMMKNLWCDVVGR